MAHAKPSHDPVPEMNVLADHPGRQVHATTTAGPSRPWRTHDPLEAPAGTAPHLDYTTTSWTSHACPTAQRFPTRFRSGRLRAPLRPPHEPVPIITKQCPVSRGQTHTQFLSSIPACARPFLHPELPASDIFFRLHSLNPPMSRLSKQIGYCTTTLNAPAPGAGTPALRRYESGTRFPPRRGRQSCAPRGSCGCIRAERAAAAPSPAPAVSGHPATCG
jgi:hypothetical protein